MKNILTSGGEFEKITASRGPLSAVACALGRPAGSSVWRPASSLVCTGRDRRGTCSCAFRSPPITTGLLYTPVKISKLQLYTGPSQNTSARVS